MIKPGALIMAAVMAAVAAGTYFGLDLLPPGTIPPPIGRNPPAAARTLTTNTVVSTGAASVSAPKSAAPAAEAAPAPAAAPTEQELAEEPAPKAAEPAKVTAAEPARAPVAKAQPEPEEKFVPRVDKKAPKAEPAPEPAPAPKAEPAPTPKPAAPAEPAKVARSEGPAAAAAPAATASDEPEAPKTQSKTAADADVIKQWWPEPSKLPPTQLKLMYAGDVQGEAAIGLLFSEAPNIDSLKLHARVRSIGGAEVGGTWVPGKNPRLVVFRGLTAGVRYTVILDKELADVKGFALGQTLQGPVYIPKR